MPEAAHRTPEIDCPYFQLDWVLDHPEWPADLRLTTTIPDTEQEH